MKQDCKYNLFRSHDALSDFYTHINVYRYSTFDSNAIFYCQIYIYICMIYALLKLSIHLSLSVIMLKTPRFKSFVLFQTHTLLYMSFRILLLPTLLSNLNYPQINSNVILECID